MNNEQTAIIEAINAAADFIAKNPKQYNFVWTTIPNTPHCPGCALAWIGYFLNESKILKDKYTSYGLQGIARQILKNFNFENPCGSDGRIYVIWKELDRTKMGYGYHRAKTTPAILRRFSTYLTKRVVNVAHIAKSKALKS